MDPHAILGVRPDADEEDVARAYRELAKLFHPDHRPDDAAAAARMAEINIAYELLRDAAAKRPPPARSRSRTAGAWLPLAVRKALGRELLRALEPDERVLVVTDAATWDSPRVRLAVSNRRLLWLRADAPTDRVRYLRWEGVETIDGRLRRPLRRVGELLVQPRNGRRISFSEIEPGALRLVLLGARRHVS